MSEMVVDGKQVADIQKVVLQLQLENECLRRAVQDQIQRVQIDHTWFADFCEWITNPRVVAGVVLALSVFVGVLDAMVKIRELYD
jgi:hypothetical protein